MKIAKIFLLIKFDRFVSDFLVAKKLKYNSKNGNGKMPESYSVLNGKNNTLRPISKKRHVDIFR